MRKTAIVVFRRGTRIKTRTTILSFAIALLSIGVALASDSVAAKDKLPVVTVRVTTTGLFWNEAELSSVEILREWVRAIPADTPITILALGCMKWTRLDEVLEVFRTSHLPAVAFTTYIDSECTPTASRENPDSINAR
jgi:hypothetical protein